MLAFTPEIPAHVKYDHEAVYLNTLAYAIDLAQCPTLTNVHYDIMESDVMTAQDNILKGTHCDHCGDVLVDYNHDFHCDENKTHRFCSRHSHQDTSCFEAWYFKQHPIAV